MMANILRRLRVSLLVLCLWAGAAVPAAAQQTDSLRRDSVPDVSVSLPAGEAAFRTEPGVVPVADRLRAAAPSDSVPTYRFVPPRLGPQRPYAVHPSPLFRGDYSAGGVMGRAGGGFVVGAGSQERDKYPTLHRAVVRPVRPAALPGFRPRVLPHLRRGGDV